MGFDTRNMKHEMNTLRGHKREVLCINWHPLYGHMLVSGGGDGSILYWDISLDKQVGGIENAHDGIIWDIKWHPLGHIVASASNDFATKFWTRNNPGDRMRDKYNLKLDEELEAEELVANPEPDPRAMSNVPNDDQDEIEYQEVDTTIPALNPEETARIPKERRKRYMPPQFTADSFGLGEKIRRGDKRIDPRFKLMWNSYQRPDLLRDDFDDLNVPTYDGDVPPYDRREPILGREPPPPWRTGSRRPHPRDSGGFRDRDGYDERDYDDRNRRYDERNRDYDRYRDDQQDRFQEPRFDDDVPFGNHRDRDDRRDNRDPYSNGFGRPEERDFIGGVEQGPDDMHGYRDYDFRGGNNQHQPPPPGHGGDFDYRSPNGPPHPRIPMKNEYRRPPPPIREPYQSNPRYPMDSPHPRGPPPRGQSGKGGLNWYS